MKTTKGGNEGGERKNGRNNKKTGEKRRELEDIEGD